MGALPDFFRRISLLRDARQALLEGRVEVALELASDPRLALSPSAEKLRERALGILRRRAVEAAGAGRADEAQRLLRLVLSEDPTGGGQLKDELQPLIDSARPEERARKMAQELADLRRKSTSVKTAPAEARHTPLPAVPRARPVVSVPGTGNGSARPEPMRFLLGVDDYGEFLVACGEHLILGHCRNARAALRFLANVEDEHAVLHYAGESFHSGPRWTLERAHGRSVQVNGREIGSSGHELADCDVVQLSSNLAFRVRVPDAASSSAVLELEDGVECEGAVRVLLIGPGEAGRVGIGSRASDHVQVPGLDEEILLEFSGGKLRAVAVAGPDAATGARVPKLEIDCPPRSRTDLELGIAGRKRPFGLSIRPLL